MKHRRYYPLLLLLAVLITTTISCKRGGTTTKSSVVSHDSAYARFDVAQNYYNNNEHDSLIAVAPEILEFLRDNQEWRLFYILWQYVAEDYVWFNEFDEATKEALAMQEDAIARNDSFGIAMSYEVQGTAYLVQDVYDEAQRCYKNFIQIYPDKEGDGPLTEVYYFYYQCLENANDSAAIDSLLKDWALLLKDLSPTTDPDQQMAYASWRLKYFRRQFSYLVAKDSLTQATHVLDSIDKYTELAGNVVVEQINTIDDRCELAMAKGDYTAALRYANENLEHATGDVGNRRMVLMNRSKVFEKLGQYREALADLRASEALKDSVNQAKNREQLNRLNKRFALNELQSQNKLLKQRSRFTTGGVAMILGIGAILVFLVLNSRWNRKLQIKNMQLQRERNVVVAQNRQLEIERDHAEAASRAKTAFMQSMTHEIRTPLNAISGFTQVLNMKDIDLPESERKDFCERIQENTRLLTTILDDLLLISDMESRSELPPPETCVVSAVATQAIDMVRSLVANTVILDCQCELPVEQTIDSYPRMINIVLAKLLENAAKFTTVGNITLKLTEKDSVLHFSVVDTGPGIPPDKKDYIFERFTKLDTFAQGTGLGLTVARMIAERLGGTLTLDTEYKNGSKFDFILPIKV